MDRIIGIYVDISCSFFAMAMTFSRDYIKKFGHGVVI